MDVNSGISDAAMADEFDQMEGQGVLQKIEAHGASFTALSTRHIVQSLATSSIAPRLNELVPNEVGSRPFSSKAKLACALVDMLDLSQDQNKELQVMLSNKTTKKDMEILEEQRVVKNATLEEKIEKKKMEEHNWNIHLMGSDSRRQPFVRKDRGGIKWHENEGEKFFRVLLRNEAESIRSTSLTFSGGVSTVKAKESVDSVCESMRLHDPQMHFVNCVGDDSDKWAILPYSHELVRKHIVKRLGRTLDQPKEDVELTAACNCCRDSDRNHGRNPHQEAPWVLPKVLAPSRVDIEQRLEDLGVGGRDSVVWKECLDSLTALDDRNVSVELSGESLRKHVNNHGTTMHILRNKRKISFATVDQKDSNAQSPHSKDGVQNIALFDPRKLHEYKRPGDGKSFAVCTQTCENVFSSKPAQSAGDWENRAELVVFKWNILANFVRPQGTVNLPVAIIRVGSKWHEVHLRRDFGTELGCQCIDEIDFCLMMLIFQLLGYDIDGFLTPVNAQKSGAYVCIMPRNANEILLFLFKIRTKEGCIPSLDLGWTASTSLFHNNYDPDVLVAKCTVVAACGGAIVDSDMVCRENPGFANRYKGENSDDDEYSDSDDEEEYSGESDDS